MTDDLVALLSRLIAADLEFVVVGGVAAFMHGSDQLTRDLDILAVFTPANMTRLLAALHDLHPYNSARPDLGELRASPEELARHRNLYLGTDLGRLDVLGELPRSAATPRSQPRRSTPRSPAARAGSSDSIT